MTDGAEGAEHSGRIQLDETSWVDVRRNWLGDALGVDGGELFRSLRDGVVWDTRRLFRYDHWVEERRLGSFWRPGAPLPHAALADVHRALRRDYAARFEGFGLIHYRDGRDGQGFHRDTDLRWLDDTVIAVLSLGARRPWLLRPWSSKYDHSPGQGATHDLQPGPGDLIVMGGRAQADWQHSVPYLSRGVVGPRISLQWRYTTRRGEPYRGTSYRVPLTYRRQDRATATSNSAQVSAETFPDWGDVDDWCIDDVQVWEDRVYMSIEHRHTNYRWVVPLGEFVKE